VRITESAPVFAALQLSFQEDDMKVLVTVVIATSLVVPAVVLAQSADSKYCSVLADKYDAYLETAGDKGGRSTPVEIVKAMESCKSDPAPAIPVLEKALKAARFSLPPRG
jgi:hypothetical protein